MAPCGEVSRGWRDTQRRNGLLPSVGNKTCHTIGPPYGSSLAGKVGTRLSAGAAPGQQGTRRAGEPGVGWPGAGLGAAGGRARPSTPRLGGQLLTRSLLGIDLEPGGEDTDRKPRK